IINSWSRDYVLYSQDDPAGGADLMAVSTRDRHPFAVVNTKATERQGQFSPDGQWIAYVSDEAGGPFEVYAQAFPSGGKWQISTAGGAQPRWSSDGREIFYIGLDSRLMVVPITVTQGGSALQVSKAAALFATTVVGGVINDTAQQQYAVSNDGKRF